MKTYCKKMKVLSIGMDRRHAVSNLLKKKYPGTTSLHLLCLSILRTTVLKDSLACLIFMTSNLLQTTVMMKRGTTAERVIIIYETTSAAFLSSVEVQTLQFQINTPVEDCNINLKMVSMYLPQYTSLPQRKSNRNMTACRI